MDESKEGLNPEVNSQPKESRLGKIIRDFQKFARNTERITDHLIKLPFLSINYRSFEKGFRLEDSIRNSDGPVIEVGGPSSQNWYLADIKNSGKKMYISNLHPGNPVYDIKHPENKEPIKYQGKIDFRADATKLPLADQSTGVLFTSCLPKEIIPGMLTEAKRVLKDGALLITSGVNDDDIKEAEVLGFKQVEQIKYRSHSSNNPKYDAVFRKPKVNETVPNIIK